jgi:hypothetical protein
MDLTTYSGLQSAVGTFLVRGDQTANIPGLIALGEVRLNRVLRARRAELDVSLTGVPGSRTIALPSTYTEALTCWITLPSGTEREEMRFVDPAHIDTSTIAGRPYGWTIEGTNLGFEKPCDQAYAFTLRCLEKFILSDAAPTNSLLTDAPDLYLYSALCEAGPLLRDADQTAAYEGKLSRAIGEFNAKEARSRAQQTLSTEPGRLTRLSGSRSGYNIYSDGYRG